MTPLVVKGERPTPLIGWIDGEEIWLDPTISYRAVAAYLGKEWRYSEDEVQRQLSDAVVNLDEAGEIKVTTAKGEKGHRWPKKTTGSGRLRVVPLDRRVLGEVTFSGLRAVEDEESGPGMVLDS